MMKLTYILIFACFGPSTLFAYNDCVKGCFSKFQNKANDYYFFKRNSWTAIKKYVKLRIPACFFRQKEARSTLIAKVTYVFKDLKALAHKHSPSEYQHKIQPALNSLFFICALDYDIRCCPYS